MGKAGRYTATVHIKRQPPIEWSVICGDFIHNLRSALDHLVWQLVLANGRTPKAGFGGNQFPIQTTRPPDLRRKDTPVNRQLRGVHRSVRAAIQRIQPYHRGDEADAHPLAVLASLSNEDKHQAILPSYSAIPAAPFQRDEFPFKLTLNDVEPIEQFQIHVDKPLEDGAEIIAADIRITGPNPSVHLQGNMPFDVAFGEAMIPMASLGELRNSVHRVFEGLRPVFP